MTSGSQPQQLGRTSGPYMGQIVILSIVTLGALIVSIQRGVRGLILTVIVVAWQKPYCLTSTSAPLNDRNGAERASPKGRLAPFGNCFLLAMYGSNGVIGSLRRVTPCIAEGEEGGAGLCRWPHGGRKSGRARTALIFWSA